MSYLRYFSILEKMRFEIPIYCRYSDRILRMKLKLIHVMPTPAVSSAQQHLPRYLLADSAVSNTHR